MLVIGTDYHPSFQQIAFCDTATGECGERRLLHSNGEAAKFYRSLSSELVRVGMEATGHSRWFERLLAELQFELWIGNPAKIRAARVGKQKNDRGDAEHLLRLLLEERFPRIWIPTPAERDVRQLVLHRHRLVGMRTRVKNQLQALAMNEGVQRRKKLWSERGRAHLESLALAPWEARRRKDLLDLLDKMDHSIGELNPAIQEEAGKRPEVQLLMTHPGGGALTALAYVLTIGPWERFRSGKQVASYLGLIPSENSSGGRQRLGHITKQGNSLVRYLLVEAVYVAVRCQPDWRRAFLHLAARRGGPIARIGLARKLAVHLYWMLRRGWDYERMMAFGSHAE